MSPMPPSSGHVVSGIQDFILKHFMEKKMMISCGQSDKGYAGKIVECADGVVTLQRDDGKRLYVAVDKVEVMTEA